MTEQSETRLSMIFNNIRLNCPAKIRNYLREIIVHKRRFGDKPQVDDVVAWFKRNYGYAGDNHQFESIIRSVVGEM